MTSESEPPKPLVREIPPPEPYPVDALGTILGNAAKGIHEKTKAPIALCAQSVLACATLGAQTHCNIQLPMGHVKPVSNNYMSIAASGERKSACDTEALRAVRQHEEKLRLQHDAESFDHMNEFLAWDTERKKVKKEHEKKSKEEFKKALDKLGNPPPSPLLPMLLCSEPTFEGLCRLLKEGIPSLGIFSGEGGQFIGGHGMTEENKLRTATGLSSVWDGEPIRRVRAGEGSYILSGKRVTTHLMVQPDVASIMLGDELLADQGLLSRMLITAPESSAGTRFWSELSSSGEENIKKYEQKMLSIFEIPLPLAQGKNNELQPRHLPLAPEAKRIWTNFANHIERQIRKDGRLEPVRGLANKLPEHAMRIAAVINFFDTPVIGQIESEYLDAGIEISKHYCEEALRMFGISKINPDLALAQKLLHWLQSVWSGFLVSLPDIYQRGPHAFRDQETAKKIVDILMDHGWLEKLDGAHVVAGARRRDVWRIYQEND